MHRIDGPGATVDNRFTDGDPVGGVQATMVTDDWANDVQEELMSILVAGGVAPVKGTQNQVLSALTTLIRGQGFNSSTTAGTSPDFAITPYPAIDAYATPQRFSVKFHAAAPAGGTLDVSGKGPKNLKQYDSTGSKIAAVIVEDMISDVEYDGTDMVVLDPLQASQGMPFGYFSGFRLANNAATPNTTVDVGAGAARSSDNTVDVVATTTMRGVLQSTGAWAPGDNQNKLSSGSRANNATYFIYRIRKTSDGTSDLVFDPSATTPSLPSGYSGFVYIGRIATDASGNIRAFKDRGNGRFDWVTPNVEATVTGIAPTTALIAISGMSGVPVEVVLNVLQTGDGTNIKITAADVTDQATSTGPGNYTGGIPGDAGGGSNAESAGGFAFAFTDTAGQVRVRNYSAAGNIGYRIVAMGWKEYR